MTRKIVTLEDLFNFWKEERMCCYDGHKVIDLKFAMDDMRQFLKEKEQEYKKEIEELNEFIDLLEHSVDGKSYERMRKDYWKIKDLKNKLKEKDKEIERRIDERGRMAKILFKKGVDNW